jgi:mannosyltransferase OCH1-like enzyme
MIPKKIHFCWFSGSEYPKLVKRCLRSWKRKLPDYTIREWNKNSFDFNSVPFVKEAIEQKKWAFAADYMRLYALYTEGGIYLDSDVEVLKKFDTYLTHKFFTGTEPYIKNNQIYYDIEAAIMGSEKGHPFLKECLDSYNNMHFVGTKQETICHFMSRNLEKYGYVAENKYQELDNSIVVYPLEHYGNRYCFHDKTAIHWCQSSWLDTYYERGPLYYFAQKHDLMKQYEAVSEFKKKIWKR